MDLRSKNEVMLQMQIQKVEEEFRENRRLLKRISDRFRQALGFDMLAVILGGYLAFDTLQPDWSGNILCYLIIASLVPFGIAAYSAYCRTRVGMYMGMACSVLTCALMVLLSKSQIIFLPLGLAIAGITVVMKFKTLETLREYEKIQKLDGYPFESAMLYVKKINAANPEYKSAPEPERKMANWDDDMLPPVSLDD